MAFEVLQNMTMKTRFEVILIMILFKSVNVFAASNCQSASDHQFVPVVLIATTDKRDRSAEYCAGPVVNGCYILTSAHCVLSADGKTPSPAIKIYSGKYADSPEKDLGRVSKIHIFPKYLSANNKNIYDNSRASASAVAGSDLAVIELAKCVDESLSLDLAPVNSVEKVTLVGYGRGVPPAKDESGRLVDKVGRQSGGTELGDFDETKLCLKEILPGEECRPESGSVIIRNNKVLGFTAYTVQSSRAKNKTISCGVNFRNPEVRNFLIETMSQQTAASKPQSGPSKHVQSVK
jgi:hypothetical protein